MTDTDPAPDLDPDPDPDSNLTLPHEVRFATPDDEPFLRTLQGLLPEPSPELLGYGLSAGTVLVTTAIDATIQSIARDETAHSTAADETRLPTQSTPVGYLLAIPGDHIHIAELVVAPEYRREGRASSLLAALLARCPSGERVTLTVACDNDAAQSLYRTVGFEQVGTSETLFENSTALLFERDV